MIRVFKREQIVLGPRPPHEEDINFVNPHYSELEAKHNPPTERDLEQFRRKSVFGKMDLVPDLSSSWNGPVTIAGPTKSGKTWLAGMLMYDSLRPVYVISDIRGDPSLRYIKKQRRLHYVQFSEDLEMKEFSGGFLLFDDITDKETLKWRDKAFKQGRHFGISCIAIVHDIMSGFMTKAIVNESEWICLFPQANSSKIANFMDKKLRLKSRLRGKILSKAQQDGRYLFFHQWNPTFAMTSSSVIPY